MLGVLIAHAGAEAVDSDALATQIHRYRCAVQLGINQSAARSAVGEPSAR